MSDLTERVARAIATSTAGSPSDFWVWMHEATAAVGAITPEDAAAILRDAGWTVIQPAPEKANWSVFTSSVVACASDLHRRLRGVRP